MTAGHTWMSQAQLRLAATSPRAGFEAGERRIRALVLLSGVVRSTELSVGLRRSVLDLPVDGEHSVLDAWQQHATALAQMLRAEELPVRIMVNHRAARPTVRPSGDHLIRVRAEADAGEYRGTGGVLRDLAESYNGDDYIVVANGGQLMVESLPEVVLTLTEAGGDVSLISHQDGTPTGLMLVRCGVLRSIPAVGFVDMKEQALPGIATHHKVTVVNRERPVAVPIRTREDYLRALLRHHRRRAEGDDQISPLTERWRPTFAIVEAGADVNPTARIHDSVVLQGGRVEGGATVVHSIVCAGGVVRGGRIVTDRVVGPSEKWRRRSRK